MIRSALLGAAAVVAAAGALIASRDDAAPTRAAPTGQVLFAAKGCATCHRGPDNVEHFDAAPPLINAASWAGDRRPEYDAVSYLAESIRSPNAFISPAWGESGPTAMPDLGLSDAEIDRLVDYLLQS